MILIICLCCLVQCDVKPLYCHCILSSLLCGISPWVQPNQQQQNQLSFEFWHVPCECNRGYALPRPLEVTGFDGEWGVNCNEQLYTNGMFDWLQGLVEHPPFFVDGGQAEGIPQRKGAFHYWQEKWAGSQSERFYWDRRVGVVTWHSSIQRSTSGETYRFWGVSVFKLEQDWIIWSQRGVGMHVSKMYGGLHKELPYRSLPLSTRTGFRCEVNLFWVCHFCEM